jgi:multisubunit Na+/H+ antiporter MnhG subunit
MGLIIAIIFAKIGSKRIIGAVDSFLLCLLLAPVGIYLVLKSRRLDDSRANEALLKEYTPITTKVKDWSSTGLD